MSAAFEKVNASLLAGGWNLGLNEQDEEGIHYFEDGDTGSLCRRALQFNFRLGSGWPSDLEFPEHVLRLVLGELEQKRRNLPACTDCRRRLVRELTGGAP